MVKGKHYSLVHLRHRRGLRLILDVRERHFQRTSFLHLSCAFLPHCFRRAFLRHCGQLWFTEGLVKKPKLGRVHIMSYETQRVLVRELRERPDMFWDGKLSPTHFPHQRLRVRLARPRPQYPWLRSAIFYQRTSEVQFWGGVLGTGCAIEEKRRPAPCIAQPAASLLAASADWCLIQEAWHPPSHCCSRLCGPSTCSCRWKWHRGAAARRQHRTSRWRSTR